MKGCHEPYYPLRPQSLSGEIWSFEGGKKWDCFVLSTILVVKSKLVFPMKYIFIVYFESSCG